MRGLLRWRDGKDAGPGAVELRGKTLERNPVTCRGLTYRTGQAYLREFSSARLITVPYGSSRRSRP